MARGPLAAAMVGKTIGRKINEGKVPVYISRFGNKVDEIFITAPQLKKTYKGRFGDIPPRSYWSIYIFPEACTGPAPAYDR